MCLTEQHKHKQTTELNGTKVKGKKAAGKGHIETAFKLNGMKRHLQKELLNYRAHGQRSLELMARQGITYSAEV